MTDVAVDWKSGLARGTAGSGFSTERASEEVGNVGYSTRSFAVVESSESQSTKANMPGEYGYDLLILGGGSAAFAAAIKARDLGARVAIVEQDTVGGTCVNVGCVPSKALLRAAEHYWRAGHSPYAGVPTSSGEVDLPALVAQKADLVDRMRREKYEDLLDHYDIGLIYGTARFVDPETVEVDGQRLRAFRYLVVTGADAWIPPIEGIDRVDYLTSTTALELTDVPGQLIVVGANAIGLELGQLFLHLGSRVTFVEALDRIAPCEEPEVSTALQAHLESQGAVVHTAARTTSAGRAGDRIWLDVGTGDDAVRLEAERLLIATGRRARTEGLGLEAAGVDVDNRGQIQVKDTMETSNPVVYAAGDVTSHPQFVYVAALGGSIAAENALRDTSRRIDFATMPRVTFTTPAIASVGLTEAQAREAGHRVVTSTVPLDVVPRALVDHATDGLVKLVADEATGSLLGVHILAEGAGDVIQAAVMALKYRAGIDEIADTYHSYLTMAEALKLAAQGFNKDVKTLSCCAA
ncbi:MAG TPA: mercury(II) reductase [Acidimicrobiia bacterium]